MAAYHSFYAVDPSLLPAAGAKPGPQGPPSKGLGERQAVLSRWHIDHQHRMLGRLGMASLSSGSRTPRGPLDRGDGSHATVGLPSAKRHDARLGAATSVATHSPGMDMLIDGLRRRLRSKGVDAELRLEAMFGKLDSDGNGVLSTQEFREGLQNFGLLNDDGECDLIFAYFDEDRSGAIDYSEFLDALKGRLPERRRAVVREAFETMDCTGDGVVNVEDMREKFVGLVHPEVHSGVKTEDEAFAEFLHIFDVISPDGNITLAEFERYYENLSALIPSDELFDATVRQAWKLKGSTGGSCLRLGIKRRANMAHRNPQAYRGPNQASARGFNNGVGQVIQEFLELRPGVDVHVHDVRFFDAVRKKLEDLGYTDVEEFEVLGNY